MLKVYYADITPLLQKEVWEKNVEQVRRERKEKALKCKIRMDQCRSLGAGLLLKTGLLREGVSYGDAMLLIGPHGKPELVGLPELYFSISHAGAYAAAAFSNVLVGVDIEQTDRNWSKVMQRVYTPNELDYIEICSEDSNDPSIRRIKTAEIWTRKESYAKLKGKGMLMDFKDIDTLCEGCFYTCMPDEEHVLTACLLQEEEETRLYEVGIGKELEVSRIGVI